MLMTVKFIQQRGGSWRYRRKVPEALRNAIGKGELVFPLGTSEAEALRHYPKAHDHANKILARAQAPQSILTTPLELHKAAHHYVLEQGLSPQWDGWETPNDQEGIARSVLADAIIDRYRRDDEGDPIGLSLRDRAVLLALHGGARDGRPAPTLEDARKLYLEEKVGDDKKKRQQLEHIFKLIAPVVRMDDPLANLKRADAKEVRECLLDGRTAESAGRYLNTLRALVNHDIKEFELAGMNNPFDKLPVTDKERAVPERRKRDVFTEDELVKARAYVMGVARTDIQHIWRILENTGCRPSEVAGLRVQDVYLDHAIPHIDIEWHENRRIKTLSSRRKVPLIGDALDAAREAINAAGNSQGLFSAYFREGGPDSLSAALSKHVRACVTRPKVVPYSLRHRIKDRLELAGAQPYDIFLVLGHTSGTVNENYGGEEARLIRAKNALEEALSPRVTALLTTHANPDSAPEAAPL